MLETAESDACIFLIEPKRPQTVIWWADQTSNVDLWTLRTPRLHFQCDFVIGCARSEHRSYDHTWPWNAAARLVFGFLLPAKNTSQMALCGREAFMWFLLFQMVFNGQKPWQWAATRIVEISLRPSWSRDLTFCFVAGISVDIQSSISTNHSVIIANQWLCRSWWRYWTNLGLLLQAVAGTTTTNVMASPEATRDNVNVSKVNTAISAVIEEQAQ